MKKIIAREVNPAHVDFSIYFDDDGLKSSSGENCACYIPGDRNHFGFNNNEYREIVEQADSIIEGFEDVTSGYIETFNEVMTDNGIQYTSRKCHLLKEWAKTADTSDTDDVADFLTITTGGKMEQSRLLWVFAGRLLRSSLLYGALFRKSYN